MAYAYDLTGDTAYLDGAYGAMDYIMGRNPLDISYVTGYGTHTVENPHHRWWSKQVDEAFPSAPNGVLSGGPNSGLQDPWVKGLGWEAGEMAPQLCYVDHIEAWSTNECTINWNAPLAWVAGFMTNEATRDVKELVYDDGSDDEEDKDKEKEDSKNDEEDTEKEKTNTKKTTTKKVLKDDVDTDEKSSDKSDSSDDNDEKPLFDKIKDILAIVGGAVIGLLVLIGLVSVIKTVLKLKKKD